MLRMLARAEPMPTGGRRSRAIDPEPAIAMRRIQKRRRDADWTRVDMIREELRDDVFGRTGHRAPRHLAQGPPGRGAARDFAAVMSPSGGGPDQDRQGPAQFPDPRLLDRP